MIALVPKHFILNNLLWRFIVKQYSLTILCLLSLFIVSCTSSHNPKRTTNGTVQTNGTTQNDELPDELPFDLANRGDSYTHTPQQVVNALKCQVAYEQCKSAPIRKVPFYVSFDTNKASLNRKGRKALEELSIAFEREKSLFIRNRLIIAGHTDSRGKEWYNMQLSEKRALTVKNYLANELGISSSHFIAEGYGEEQPIEKNDTPQKRARNRRVEFRLFNSN
jgi:outer membrane protein OmpA-like peptidoglycan-associated protein